MIRLRNLAMVVSILANLFPLAAQGVRETFEVASVKPNNRTDGQQGIVVDPGRLTVTGVALLDLIRYAYGFNSLATKSQVIGGPSWVGTARFDIVATSNGQPTLGMLKSLLEDRFKVITHMESRERPIFSLLLNRSDRKLGPKIHPSSSTCDGAGVTLPQSSLQEKNRCGIRGRPGSYSAEGASMEQLARALANFPVVDRVVVDQTGMSGVFDWTLEWTPSFNNGPGRDTIVANPDADAGQSLFSALRDQLGLRLEAGRAAVETLIVDRAELPTPD